MIVDTLMLLLMLLEYSKLYTGQLLHKIFGIILIVLFIVHKDGDVVMTSKGSRFKVAVAEVGNRKIIPNANILVLRLNTKKLIHIIYFHILIQKMEVYL